MNESPLPIMDESKPRGSVRSLRFFTRFRMPIVALLVLFAYWAWGLWLGYTVQNPHAYDESTEVTVLHVVDRTLRINDALKDEPEWVRDLLGYQSPGDALLSARESLEFLEKKGYLQDEGKTVMALLNHLIEPSEERDESSNNLTSRIIRRETIEPDAIAVMEQSLREPTAQWWDIELARQAARQQSLSVFEDEIKQQQVWDHGLLIRAKIGALLSMVIFLIGVFLLPLGIKRMHFFVQRNHASHTVRYTQHWSVTLLLFLIIATQLAGDAVIRQLYILVGDSYTYGWQIFGDFIWRMLPPALLLILLFRKPRYMIKGFQLAQKPDGVLIFSIFSALIICDHMLYGLLGGMVEFDPTIGVDVAENGWRGLFFGVLSACFFAPIAEELVYRGFLFNTLLRKMGFWMSAIVVSLVFAISHYYDLYGTLSVGLFGFSTAVLYYATRSLTNTILLHVLYNFSITLPTWLVFHYPY